MELKLPFLGIGKDSAEAGNPQGTAAPAAMTETARSPAAAESAAQAPVDRLSQVVSWRLPVIGHLPFEKQTQAMLLALGALILLAGLTAWLYNRSSREHSAYLEAATELQMLSQRMSRSAEQAAVGNPTAFPVVEGATERFAVLLGSLTRGGKVGDIEVSPLPSGVQAPLQRLVQRWGDVREDATVITGSRASLVALARNVAGIHYFGSQMIVHSEALVSTAQQGNYSAAQGAQAARLTTLTERIIRAGNQLFASGAVTEEALAVLNNDTRAYRTVLQGLAEGNGALKVVPFKEGDAQARVEQIGILFAEFDETVKAIQKDVRTLVAARRASQNVYALSEPLFNNAIELQQELQAQGGGGRGLLLATVAFGLLALAAMVVLVKIILDEVRQREQSARLRAEENERQNQRTQAAILRLLDDMTALADGDLTVQAAVTEEVTGSIADSVNFVVEELRRLVAGIIEATGQVTTATSQAQSISTQLLGAAQQQAREIQETSESVTQMAQSIEQVSQRATESATVAETSLSAAEQGSQAVQNAISGMNSIREQIQETSKRIKRLGESSQEIGEIVDLISDITEQTNVLALNAAIQATSAGPAGRGFTVVAEEVQRLAERSAEATKQISAIVKAIQHDTQDAVSAMERSTQGVVEGTRLADGAGQALGRIEGVSKQLASLIAVISAETREQAEAAATVKANMNDILRITDLTTEGTRKTADSTGGLAALALDLKQSVSGFKLP